ncbi:MAG: enterochelin esterase-like enzyme [Candidatus Promineifilaceae bacterium]
MISGIKAISCQVIYGLRIASRQNYHVSPDPTKSIVAGSSYGGLAAVFMGLRHSNIVGHVLSQSGSFWWKPEASVEHEWLTRQAALNEKANLTFYLEVGSLESGATPDDGPSQLVSNRHMRDVLQAKGYEVCYKEFAGGHDYLCWQGTLANGLISLVGGK